MRGVTCLHGGGRAVRDGAVRDVRGDHEAQGFPHGQTSQQRKYGVRGEGCCCDMINDGTCDIFDFGVRGIV